MFYNKLPFQIQSELSVQIQLLGGREEGDSKTRCPQLPKGSFTELKTPVTKVFRDSNETMSYLAHTVHAVPGDHRGAEKANIRRLALGT